MFYFCITCGENHFGFAALPCAAQHYVSFRSAIAPVRTTVYSTIPKMRVEGSKCHTVEHAQRDYAVDCRISVEFMGESVFGVVTPG